MELDSLQKEYTEISRKTAEMKSNLLMDESMFGESKAQVERKQQEIHQLNQKIENITLENFKINIRAQEAAELSRELNDIRAERDQLEQSITQITSYPFLRN